MPYDTPQPWDFPVHHRLKCLEHLWQDLGFFDPSNNPTPAGLPCLESQPTWLSEKLRAILFEFDRIIDAERSAQRYLVAEVEDLTEQVEDLCRTLGLAVDGIVYPHWNIALTTYKAKQHLTQVLSYLHKEITRRRSQLGRETSQLGGLITELRDTNYRPPSPERFDSELHLGRVNQITNDLHHFEREREDRRLQFDDIINRCWTAWSHIRYTPVDDLDEVLGNLFTESNPGNDVVTLKGQRFVWYQPTRESPLTLAKEDLRQLTSKMLMLESRLAMNRTRKEEIVANITNLWRDANVPDNERITIPEDYSDGTIRLLETTYQGLKVQFSNITKSLYSRCRKELDVWWDLCQASNVEREDTVNRICTAAATRDDVLDLTQQEIAKLGVRVEQWKLVFQLINERHQLIQRMAEFERNASDPKRLFQSSFRLNEEERFRKTCFPTLLRMERKLGELLADYAKHAGYPFLLSPDSEPYHCILEQEIEQRIVNETVFGFEHPRRRSRRTPSLSAGSHLGEDTTERGSISGRRASIQSSLLLSGKPTRRSRAPSVVGDEGTVSVRSPVPSVVSDVKEGGKFTATSMDGIKGTVHDADEVPDSQGGDRDESITDDRSVAGSVTSRRTSVLSVTTQGRSTRSSHKPSTGTGGVSRPVSAMSRRGPSKPNSSTSQWAPGPLPSPNAALRRPFPAEKSSPGNCRPPIRRVGSVSSLKSMPSLPSRSSVNKSVTPNHSGPSEAATVPRLKSRKSVVGTLPTTPTPAGGGGLSRGGGPTSPLTGTAETSRTFAPSLTRKHHGQSPQSNSRGPICMTCNQRQGTPLVASGSRTPVQLSPRLPNTSVIGNGGLVKTSTLQSPTFRSRSSLRTRSSMADLRQLSQSQTSQSTSLETSMDAPKCKATEPLSPPVSPPVCNVLKTEAVVPTFSPQANTPASPHHHDRSAHLHTPNTPIKELNNFDSVATETPNTFT